MTRGVAANIVASRLLVLQSKRLMLNSLERRLDSTGAESMRPRVIALREQTATALHAYRETMLRLGSPESADFWIVAYSRMIDVAQGLTIKLRSSVVALPPTERYEAALDVEMLEDIVEHWTESLHESMMAATA